MDPAQARELLAQERARIERELASLERQGAIGDSDRREPGDEGSEDLYEEEVSQGRREELRDELAAVARAEQRLAAGAYGLSVESGESLPHERPAPLPAAERPVGEDERYRRS